MMVIFMSVYGIVDGFFVSNFVGKTPFAAVNLIMPFPFILGAFGAMFGTGGSALVAKTMGEGERDKANRIFSLLVYTCIIVSVVMAVTGIVFMRQVAQLFGAEGEMLEYCVVYGRILMAALPGFMLQNMFQSFFITAERPDLGFKLTVVAGVANMVMDALFIAVWNGGVVGAALATGISQCIGGIFPLVYFAKKNSSALRLTGTRFDGKALFKSCTNGASEFVTSISLSVVSIFYNFQLIRFAGEDGVAAYGVIMYVCLIFIGIMLGYAMGTAPIFSYDYGAGNDEELKNVFRKSMILVLGAGVVLSTIAVLSASPFARIFVGYDPALTELTTRAFRLFSVSFLFSGFGIFGSSFFTALNNGAVSALISFLRTLLFQIITILILPEIWGLDGVWYAISVAEAAAAVVSVFFIIKYRKVYHYS